VAHFFIADVHLRLDQPTRGRRLAAWVDCLEPSDELTIVGDLCDFWFAARQSHRDWGDCPGLSALSRYSRRGGRLTILAGNHDNWLGARYVSRLGARFVPDTLDLEIDGVRIHLAHGHRLGGVGRLKRIMESRAFLHAFGLTPGPIARRLEARLDKTNTTHRSRDDQRQSTKFERYTESLSDRFDLVVIGHLHLRIDTMIGSTRMIVPGSWHEAANYVVVDQGRIETVSRADGASQEPRRGVTTGAG
jgi:UDP-2,3-diacylglucosamine hydrolase